MVECSDLQPIVVFPEGEIKLLGKDTMEQTEMFWKCLMLPLPQSRDIFDMTEAYSMLANPFAWKKVFRSLCLVCLVPLR